MFPVRLRTELVYTLFRRNSVLIRLIDNLNYITKRVRDYRERLFLLGDKNNYSVL
jgi:hypothetical protein